MTDQVATTDTTDTTDSTLEVLDEKLLTVEQNNKIVQTRLGAQAAKFNKEIADLNKKYEDSLEKAKLGELDAATAKITRLETSLKEVEANSIKKEIEAEMKLAAISEGVPLEKTKLILKLTEYTAVDGVVDSSAIYDAVKAVLKEIPELIKTPIVVDLKTTDTVKSIVPINGVAVSAVATPKPKGLAESVAAAMAAQKR